MTQEITIQYIFKFLIIWFIHNVQTDERTWFNETMIMTQEITIKYIFKFLIIWFIHNVQTDERTCLMKQ